MEDVYCYTDEDLDKAYKELEQKGIAREQLALQRYKGLGEMNPEQLWETTMDPANRTLIQVDIGELDVAENSVNVLMGDEVEPRREWIEENVIFDYDDSGFTLEEEGANGDE